MLLLRAVLVMERKIEYQRKSLLIFNSETVLLERKCHRTVSISFPTEKEAIEFIREQEEK